MLTTLRKLGNSQGIIIPKPLLAEIGLVAEADIRVENGAIVLRPVKASPREGWAEGARKVAQASQADEADWRGFGNEGDEALKW